MPGRKPEVDVRKLVRQLLDKYGQTFAQELGIKIESNTANSLFKLLVFSLLASTRISHLIALRATQAVFETGWITARKLGAATWRQRADVLNHSGYARYDESTSRYLGETCLLLQHRYDGDLRRLREAGGYDIDAERDLLKDFKGIGDVGANIFFREVQAAWAEVFPYLDPLAQKSARRLGLPDHPAELLRLCSKEDFPRLVTALVRVQLEDHYEDLAQKAA